MSHWCEAWQWAVGGMVRDGADQTLACHPSSGPMSLPAHFTPPSQPLDQPVSLPCPSRLDDNACTPSPWDPHWCPVSQLLVTVWPPGNNDHRPLEVPGLGQTLVHVISGTWGLQYRMRVHGGWGGCIRAGGAMLPAGQAAQKIGRLFLSFYSMIKNPQYHNWFLSKILGKEQKFLKIS